MTDRIVFLHLPKTGGTSMYRLLKAHFSSDLVCPERKAGLERLNQDQLQAYRLFSGHYSYESIYQLIPAPLKLVTLLREPKSRILSGYYFGRSHKMSFIESHDGHYLPAKTLGLYDYLGSQANRLRDLQVRRIASLDGSPEERLQRAKARLRDMTAFGLTELMEDSVRLIFTRLGLPVPDSIPKALAFETLAKEKNYIEHIDKEPVTPDIDARLDELTVLDRELYACACELFAERLAAERVSNTSPAILRVKCP